MDGDVLGFIKSWFIQICKYKYLYIVTVLAVSPCVTESAHATYLFFLILEAESITIIWSIYLDKIN